MRGFMILWYMCNTDPFTKKFNVFIARRAFIIVE